MKEVTDFNHVSDTGMDTVWRYIKQMNTAWKDVLVTG